MVPSAVAFGTGRMFGTLTNRSGARFRVFASHEPAEMWLGVTHEDIDELRQVVTPQRHVPGTNDQDLAHTTFLGPSW